MPTEALLAPAAREFLNAVVVDHIDGVMAEALIEQHFAERPAAAPALQLQPQEWQLA